MKGRTAAQFATTAVAIAILAALLFPARAVAGDNLSTIFGSFTYQKSDALGQTRNLGLEIDFGANKHIDFGVLLEYAYSHPPEADTAPEPLPDPMTEEAPPVEAVSSDTGSITAWSMGGQIVLHVSETHNGFVGGLGVLFPQGDADGTILKPWVGLEFGKKWVAFRAAWAHPINYGVDEHTYTDLGRDEVTAAIGFRWK